MTAVSSLAFLPNLVSFYSGMLEFSWVRHKTAVLPDLIKEGKSSTYVYDFLKGVGILKHSKFQRQIFRYRVKEKKQANWSVCSTHGYSISSLSG